MAIKKIDRDWRTHSKEIRYLNKDFPTWRKSLIDFAKAYYPTSYNDFNETSPGMMFIEMAAYVGDVLSFYIDDTLKESLLYYAQERQNVIDLAQFLGYKPKVTSAAVTTLDVYQLVPSVGAGLNNAPDYRFALSIKEGMEIVSEINPSVVFRTTNTVDFGFSSSIDPTEVTVYERNAGDGEPTYYLLKKKVEAISGQEKEVEVSFNDPTKFAKYHLNIEDLIQITDVTDSDGNKWYEVPYLAQDTIYLEVPNNTLFDPTLAEFRATVPYVLRLLSTPKRFVLKLRSDDTFEMHFGSGISDSPDEIIIPNPTNVGLGLPDNISTLGTSFDPSNFLLTKTYGESPANTTLTIKYVTGGGIESNVPQNDLNTITKIEFNQEDSTLTTAEIQQLADLKSTVTVNNPGPATGGRGPESIEEIRQNALANFSSQNRAVTRADYQVRALAMPAKFGSVAKVYVLPDGNLDVDNPDSLELTKAGTLERNNPFAVNMYILGYDINKKLTYLNQAVKENLRLYLDQHRMLTDGINIIDGFIVNIGIDFEIGVYPTYNKREVTLRCIEAVKEMFEIDQWQFNQPIIISDIELTIANVDGVRTVPKVEVINKCGGNYSDHSYDLNRATINKIIYPPIDPAVFEVKYPNVDIRGRAL